METSARAERLNSRGKHAHAVPLNGSQQLEAGNRREPWVQFTEAQETQRDMALNYPPRSTAP